YYYSTFAKLVRPVPSAQLYDTLPFVTSQMVGCTSRELRAAQRGSGFEVLKALSEDSRCGGRWLVTRAQRRVSARMGSAARRAAHLAGVSARVRWQKLSVNYS
ncbi:jg7649, partial [Pararge aegeria aegeria]